ncbi:MAG: Unknown protein [uncultured Sulfurovum sp.]|uniref:Uncharacterized protein n=1 Tax=uncultured Sulfurovum sp. TaxID=269237 RepID=A0A6S6U2M2_9BACT|nr:MAG: Unknown protein [uncultured Sulfurovum sp.]
MNQRILQNGQRMQTKKLYSVMGKRNGQIKNYRIIKELDRQ